MKGEVPFAFLPEDSVCLKSRDIIWFSFLAFLAEDLRGLEAL